MKIVLLSVVCLAVICCAVEGKLTEGEYQNAFITWQREFNLAFSADEFLTSFINFKTQVDFIALHNSKNLSWTAGLNKFSHLSAAQFKSQFLIDLSRFATTRSASEEYTGEGEHASRAATVDWRGSCGAIKDQGQCGSCWTFAAAAAIETAWKIKTGKYVILSEQQLLDCTHAQMSCNGGDPKWAMDYIKTAGGHDTGASYPYLKAKQASCAYNPANSAATVSGSTYVQANSETALQSAVQKQPVVIAMDASLSSFQSYKSGIYNDAACSATNLNHAVLAVGYGNDGAGDYWIVRNSWNTWWGDKGYFKIAKGVNRCGVATRASFPSTTGTGNKI